MALKSASKTAEKPADIEELLDVLEKGLDRLKVMYEQYFLGIQKIAPMQLHSDTERKIRDLTQMQIRNTALRYRFNQLQAKFVSYNAYWRRTTRQIENGKYTRNLSRVGRKAAITGADVPEEILAAMPKRMRDQVLRDREAALALGKRRGKADSVAPAGAAVAGDDDDEVSFIGEPTGLRAGLRTLTGAHVLDPGDGEIDLDKLLAQAEAEAAIAGAAAASSTRMAAARHRDSSATIPDEMLGIPRDAEPSPADSGVSFRPPRQTAVPAVPAPIEDLPSAPTSPIVVPTAAAPTRPSTPLPFPRAATPPPVAERPQRRTAVPAPARDTPTGGFAARSSSPVIPPVAAAPAARPKLPSVVPPTIPSVARPAAAAPRPTAGIGLPPVIPGIPSIPKPAAAATPPAAAAPSRPTTLGTPPTRAPTPPPTRAPTPPPVAAPPQRRSEPSIQKGPDRPPAGMTDADVNTLYAKYVKAKEMVGEAAGPGAYGKLLKTINAQAPKIMDQYKAKSVEFSIVVKDNQVIIRAKPKT